MCTTSSVLLMHHIPWYGFITVHLTIYLLKDMWIDPSFFPFSSVPLISLSCLIALGRTSSIMLNDSDESWRPWLCTSLWVKAFSFVPLSSFRYFVDPLSHVKEVLLYSCFPESVYHEWVLNFVKCIFYINRYCYDFSSLAC